MLLRTPIEWITSPRGAVILADPLFWLGGRRAKSRQIDISQRRRLLIVRLDEIGDMVLTTPFLRELRRSSPEAWITLVVKPSIFNLVELCPYVDEVLTFDWRTSERLSELQLHWRALRFAWAHLWRRNFEVAIVPRRDVDYYHATFLTYVSGAPLRTGYSENTDALKRKVNRRFDLMYTHVYNDTSVKHDVEHNLDILRFLGGTTRNEDLEIWLDDEDRAFAEQVLRSQGVGPDTILIAFGIGKHDAKRRWPVNRFAELGSWLVRRYGARILIVGELSERSLGDSLQQELGDGLVNMVGQSTVRQASAALGHCRLYVGNDTGPKHMAAATGVPVIEINGFPLSGVPSDPASPNRFGPRGVPHRVLQPIRGRHPCLDACTADQAHCILEVTLEEVKTAVEEMLVSDKTTTATSKVGQ